MRLKDILEKITYPFRNHLSLLKSRNDENHNGNVVSLNGQTYKRIKIRIVNTTMLAEEIHNDYELLNENLQKEIEKNRQLEILNINLKNEHAKSDRIGLNHKKQQDQIYGPENNISVMKEVLRWETEHRKRLERENNALQKLITKMDNSNSEKLLHESGESLKRKLEKETEQRKALEFINTNLKRDLNALKNEISIERKKSLKTEQQKRSQPFDENIKSQMKPLLSKDDSVQLRKIVSNEVANRKKMELLYCDLKNEFLKISQSKQDKNSGPDYKKMWQELFVDYQQLQMTTKVDLQYLE